MPVDEAKLLAAEKGAEAPARDEALESVCKSMLFTVNLSAVAIYSMAGPIIPQYFYHIGVEQKWAGCAIGIMDFAALLVTPFLTKAISTFGHKTMLLFAMCCLIFPAACFGLSDTLIGGHNSSPGLSLKMALFWRFCSGIGMGFSISTAASFVISSLAGSPHFNEIFGMGEAASGLGALIGAPFAATLYTFGGWPFTWCFAAICALPVLKIIATLPVSERVEEDGKSEGSMMQVVNMQFGLLLLSGLISITIFSGYGATLSLYLLNSAGVPQAWLGVVFFMSSLSYIGLAPVFGKMADTKGGMKIMTGGLVLTGFVMAVMLGPLSSRLFVAGTLSRILWEIAAMTTLGAALSMAFAPLPGTLALSAGNAPGAAQAIGAWMNALYATCGTIGPILGIASVNAVGFETAMLIGGFIVIGWATVLHALVAKNLPAAPSEEAKS